MKRKVIFVALILTLLMIIPTISAEDINGTQEAVLGNDDVGANASFSDLDLEIYSSSDTLNLEKDYIFNDSSDSKYTDEGIKLSKSITINGNGHYIDAKGSSRIFTISASNVVLNNITFKNANSTYGGAINWIGGGGDIINSEFINNTALDGGAVFALNSAINIENSTFVNGSAIYAGGSVYQMYGTLTISNSNFSNNAANDGGALCADSFNSFSLYSSQFISNIASRYGGAICILFNSNFNNQLSAFSNNNAGKGNNVYYVSASEMLNISPINTTLIQYDPTVVTSFPSYYNLADEGYVTPVKDQGNDGNCWAFSALAALESAILKATGKTFDFSENNMKNLAARFSDYGWSKDPNSGGNPLMAIGYLASWLGPVNESDDEYRDDGNVFSNLLDAIFHVQDVAYILRQSPEEKDAIKSAIMTYGAVATNLYWSSSYLRAGNYYCPYSFSTNHAITIVGWDDAYSRTNFRTQPAGDGAWIIKNSWGTGVGNGGYYYVSYYDKNFALSNNYVFILNDTVRYENIYQYESAKSGYYHGPATNTVVWGRNIYVCENDEFIAGISTYFDVASEYEINVDVNRSGVTVYSFSQNGSSFAGYHTIKLNNYILLKKDDVFTITIKYVGNGYLPLYRDEDMCKPYSRAGISYGSVNNMNWEDLIKFNSVACIKAFTVSKVNTTIRLNDICNVEVSNDFNLVATVCDQFGNLVNVGQVLFKINNASYVVNVTNGVANLNLSLNTTGLYNISCIFTASNYYSSNSSSQLNVYKHKADLTITVDDVFFGEEVTVKVNITNGATGNVTIVIDENHMKNVSIINNVASFTFSNFNVNNYTVHVYYAGDLNFNESLASSTFKVKKIPTSIDILQIDNLTYGNDVVIPFNITDGATGNVNVTIYKNDELIKAQLFNVRSAIVFSMLDAGNYAVTINYGGDEIHAKSQSNSSFRISKARSSISINPISDISYGDVLVVDLSWVNCSGGYYELNFNGSIIRQGNLNESLSFFDLTSGDYSLFVFNEGDGNHNSSDAIAYFSVHKVNSSVLIDVIRDIVYGNDLVVSFVVSDGCVGDVNVSVLSDGLVVGCRVVGVDGDCVFSDLDVGEYVVNVTYLGDVNHVISSICSSFNVFKSSSSVGIVPFDNISYGEVLIVDLSLVNGSGGYYELIFNGSVIRQGGLNDSLIFSDLNAGDYSLFVLNEGDANHNSSSQDTIFTVYKANSNVSINSFPDIVYGNDLVVSFVVSDRCVGDVNVSVLSDGLVVGCRVVGVDGDCVFSDLDVGEYVVNVTYLGDVNHFISSNCSSFNISKSSSSVEIVPFDNIFYGEVLIVDLSLVNGSGGYYELIFNGSVIRQGGLNDSLIFSDLNAGDYSLFVLNEGDANHNSSSGDVNFTVFKANSNVMINNVQDIVYGTDLVVSFVVSNGTGNVNASIVKNNHIIDYQIVDVNDNEIIFHDLEFGEYNVNISYLGDNNHFKSSNNHSFNVFKASSNIEISKIDDIDYGNELCVKSRWVNGSAVYQLIFDSNILEYGNLTNHMVFNRLNAGNYTIIAINNGDLNHNPSNFSVNFTINKIKPELWINVSDIVYGEDILVLFNMTNGITGNVYVSVLKNNSLIANSIVNTTVNNVKFFNIDCDTYLAKISYGGDINYLSNENASTFTITRASSDIRLLAQNSVVYPNPITIESILTNGSVAHYQLFYDGSVISEGDLNSSLVLTNLKSGNYTLNAINYGDLNHNGSNQIISFAVNKSVPNISIVPIDDVIWGSDAIIPFSISDIGSGNIEVNLAPMNITRLIDAYQRSIIFENLSLGCYDVSFKYYGDENHTEYYKDVNFNVKSAISNISLELNDKYCNCYELMLDGEIIQSNNFNNTVIFANLKEGIYTINLFDNSEFRNCINVTLSQNDYENLTIVYDNKEYVKRVADGLKLNILDFTKNIDVNVIINSIYTNTTENDSEVIKIDNVKLTLTINDLATNKENIIPVNLPSDANGYVTLEINNSTWTFDVINGSTNIVLPNLSNGMYDCVITYWGDEKYSDISTNESIVVKLNADDLVGLSQGQYITDSLSINFPNDAEGKATLIINGRTIVGDIVNSQVVFDMRGFDDGYYPYSIVYSGDSNYASFSRQGYLTIKNMKDTVILADSVTTAYLSTVYLIATLRDSNNNALNDANIVVMIDGQIFNLITDNNGQVKLPINLVPGSHICKISFNGNNVYKSSSKTVDIIVLKSNIKLKVLKKTFKRSVKVKKFKITLKNTKNNAIKRYKVSLKVKGKKYVVKTNKKGLAIFKLTKLTKKGIFVAKIMVKGNKYYNSITKKVKIKIK